MGLLLALVQEKLPEVARAERRHTGGNERL